MTDSLRRITGLDGFDAEAAGYTLRRYGTSTLPEWSSQRGCWVGYSEFCVEVRIGEERIYDGPSINDWPGMILKHARASGALDRYEQARCAESPLFAARYALAEAEGRLRAFLGAPLSAELQPDQRATADATARRMLSDPGHPGLTALRHREEELKVAIVACRERLAAIEASLTIGGLLRAAEAA